MDDNPKSRGFKHRHQKTKYKPNKALPANTPVKVAQKLGSNWDRYEQIAETPILDSRTDFSLLASAPITRVSGFQFKTDKELGYISPSQLFNLDLNILDIGISTVPFYISSGVNQEYFTDNQMKTMDSTANEYMNKYSSRMKKTDKDASIFDLYGFIREVVSTNKTENVLKGVEYKTSEDLPSTNKEEVKTLESDLEQWLDDVLDD